MCLFTEKLAGTLRAGRTWPYSVVYFYLNEFVQIGQIVTGSAGSRAPVGQVSLL